MCRAGMFTDQEDDEMDLSEIRKEIDSIDKELVDLFARRMDCSKRVAEYKIENGMDVFNAAREEKVLESVESKAGEYGKSARLLYSSIMELSRALQHDMLGSGSNIKNIIRSAEKFVPYDSDTIRIACFGAPGSYASIAAKSMFPNCETVYCSPFKDVFEAVKSSSVDFGVIPIENSSAGSVTAVYDLMLGYNLYIAAAADIKIDHCLAAVPGTKISDVTKIYSHEQALMQCSDFLGANSRAETVPFVSTAQAAKLVSESGSHSSAAICSQQAAEKYGLEIIKRGFQNNPYNTTRFIVISKKLFIESDADKISLSFALPHVTGSLYNTLCRFSAHGLNLTKIESRPRYSRSFEYNFYLDFAGTTADEDVLRLIGALSEELVDFSFLGNYKEFQGNAG